VIVPEKVPDLFFRPPRRTYAFIGQYAWTATSQQFFHFKGLENKSGTFSITRAIESAGASQFDTAFYVEVDIQNLGGLNAVLGHTGADEVYSRMARITEQHIENLRTDDHTCSFRHGGDEFSFVVVGAGNTQAQVEAALTAADREIRQYVASKGLADIEHPKHRGDASKSGAGIVFGVSRIRGQDQLADVFSAADKIVEQKKL